MKPLVTILFFLSLYLVPDLIFSQDTVQKYKISKISLSSGEVVKARNIEINDEFVYFYKNNDSAAGKTYQSYSLKEVEKIEVSTKNSLVPGLLAGTGVGLATMLIVKKNVEKPKTETFTTSGPGFTSTTTITTKKKMAPGPKLVIVAGGALLGTAIGASIKKGWETVFPNDSTTMVNIDLDISFAESNYTPVIEFSYTF